jgi:hypothetical protein
LDMPHFIHSSAVGHLTIPQFGYRE